MKRRTLIKSAAICTALATTLAVPAKGQPASGVSRVRFGPLVEVADGTRLFYRDWGEGAPVLFCHPWGLNGGIWEYN
jgi:non-heme chloroperoxidase